MTLQDLVILLMALLFSAAIVAAFIGEVACRGVSRWVKARAVSIPGVFRRLAEWIKMKSAERAARKELEDEMERQRQEEIRAKREAEANRRQNSNACHELVHPETGARWRWARMGDKRYVQHLDGDKWVTVTAWKTSWGSEEIFENHIKDDKGKKKNSRNQDRSCGWYWYGEQGWGVQLDIDFRAGIFSVNGLRSTAAGPVAAQTTGSTCPLDAPTKPEPEKEPEPEKDEKAKRPDRLAMLE